MIDGRVVRMIAPLVAALGLAACGGGESARGESASASPASGESAGAVSENPLPVVDVIDLATGEPTPLAALLPADKPLLVWFWAPW